ncbi:uncharacterized protein [Neodiprion pinetum]|uniref:Uncharacterized protein LOC107224877 n=1 Tax=Neodiprion lecontei TaxID=441921 RepID=A0A6J0C2E6_NEOLC|nr:uncharacterized protein LOC107224877 [Neodiprion lecontei]XP_046466640.1 uncharacterized protein LOC124211532 [Neodiprion pinetum]
MSRKGVALGGSKSKKIPRIFQHRRSTSPTRFPGSSTNVVAVEQVSDDVHTVEYESAPSEYQKKATKKKTKLAKASSMDKSSVGVAKPSTTNNNFYAECHAEDAETVASIEKWLKTRTESISSMDLDVIKSEVEEASGNDHRYLTDEMSHAFLDKDQDVLSMDIDLSDKKLVLGYDPVLQDLRSDKLLETCEKDEFILPAFQLDHLEPLTLTPDDMMVAGEILPSANSQPVLSNPGICLSTTTMSTQELIYGKSQCDKDSHQKNRGKSTSCSDAETSSLKQVVNVYLEGLGHVSVETSSVETLGNTLSKADECSEMKMKLKPKLKPRIIKKRSKPSLKSDNNSSFRVLRTEEQPRTSEGIMAVVAISTDKISNMTQIVINTGKEEQIYQGKTSELIEATGSFPQLSRIQNSCQENHVSDLISDGSNTNENDLVISNALEELGITDDTLESISSTEHGKMWVCPKEDCRRHFNRLYALKGHVLSHYGVRPFKCDFKGCAWAFYSEFKLKRHKETHLKRKDYICEVDNCGRRFTTVYNLLTHKKLHNRPSKVFCQVPNCQERFQTKRALELHMKSHDQSHAPYVCKQEGCGKRFYTSNALTSHQRCHSYKEIDIKCSWPGCGKLFDKPCRLKAHIRSHTGYKPYPCTFQGCNWAFSSSSKLKRHQKKHTNERKFICDVSSCGKAFMRSEHLKEHRLTHKDGRCFQCHMCDAKFSAKSSLYVHIKKHQTQDVVSSLQNTMLIDQQVYAVENEANETSLNERYITNIESSDIIETQEHSHSLDLDLDLDPIIVDTPLTGAGQCASRNNGVASNDGSHQDRIGYFCSMETCSKAYAAKSALRAHMNRIHGIKNGEQKVLQIPDEEECAAATSSVDYVTYATSQSISNDHMIMIPPHEALVVSSPELESPTFNSMLKLSESNCQDSAQSIEEPADEQHDMIDENHEGSARTDLTYSDFIRFKANSTIFNSVVGATDVVLGAGGLVEGLLLPDDLPSVYYQDDIAGTECQVLLLDSGPPESTINLRDLE